MAAQPYSKPIYSGRYRHAMDKKHRITVPARWRSDDQEAEEFYIIPDQTGSYLLVMPPGEFQKVEEKVYNQDGLTQMERREFIRRFYSSAQLCSSDKQGRMLLPEEHRRQVGIKDESELVIAGSHSRFEIWNAKRWDDIYEAGTSAYRKVADLVGL